MNGLRHYGFDLVERKSEVDDSGIAATDFVEIVDVESKQITMQAKDTAEAEIKVRELIVTMCDNALQYCEKIDGWLENGQPKLEVEYQDVCRNLQIYLAKLEKRGLNRETDVIARYINKVLQRVLSHCSTDNDS